MNKMAFRPEEVADGKLARFLNCLMEMDCEIHIWTDSYCWVVEYIEDVDHNDGLHFELVDTDQVVVDADKVKWDEVDNERD